MAPTSTEVVQQRMLRHVATCGEDPVEVTVSVDTLDRMGKLDTSLRTKVGLHPQWVADHAKGPVERAVFAVKNCADGPTLSAVARRDKRVNVAKAILGNKHHDAESCEHLQNLFPSLYCRLDHEPVLVEEVPEVAPEPERIPVPERFASPSFHYFDPDYPFRGLVISEFPEDARSEEVDELVTLGLEINAPAAVRRIIHDCYLETRDPRYPRTVWDSMSFHPVDLLNQLTQEERVEILSGALTRRRLSGRWAPKRTAHRWDHQFVAALIAADVDPDARVATTRDAMVSVFTPKALRLVLETPAWHNVLAMHRPNSREIKIILKALDGNTRDLYTTTTGYSREAIATVLAYKGPGALDPVFTEAAPRDTARAFTGPEDPLFERVLKIMGTTALTEYLLRGMCFRGTTVQHPPLAQLPWFAEKINASEEAVEALRKRDIRASGLSGDPAPVHAGATYLEWSRTLVDQVRGAWELALVSPNVATIMEGELRKCGVNPLDAVRLLSHENELPALTWPQVLARLKQAKN